MNIQEAQEIISILGKDNIEKIHSVTGGKKISFALLKRILLYQLINEEIERGGSFVSIAEKYGVSKMTIYRMEQNLRKSNRNEKNVTVGRIILIILLNKVGDILL